MLAEAAEAPETAATGQTRKRDAAAEEGCTASVQAGTADTLLADTQVEVCETALESDERLATQCTMRSAEDCWSEREVSALEYRQSRPDCAQRLQGDGDSEPEL